MAMQAPQILPYTLHLVLHSFTLSQQGADEGFGLLYEHPIVAQKTLAKSSPVCSH